MKIAIKLANRRRTKNKPKVTAVSYIVSEERKADALKAGVELFTDQIFENISYSKIESADLITDLCGVLSYTKYPAKVLSRYFKLLKPGGMIIAVIDNVTSHPSSFSRSPLTLFDRYIENSSTVTVRGWLLQKKKEIPFKFSIDAPGIYTLLIIVKN